MLWKYFCFSISFSLGKKGASSSDILNIKHSESGLPHLIVKIGAHAIYNAPKTATII